MVLMLFNVAEDARIEELMKKRYKGSEENFSNVLKMILEKNMSGLKELRIEKKMTQKEVADLAGISLRSYKSYENELTKLNEWKKI